MGGGSTGNVSTAGAAEAGPSVRMQVAWLGAVRVRSVMMAITDFQADSEVESKKAAEQLYRERQRHSIDDGLSPARPATIVW